METNKLETVFNNFNNLNILVVGDVMIDSYINGSVHRISPEAPVPVLSVNSREMRLGGAANVALNIKALGANPIVCTLVGNDTNATKLIELFNENKIESKGVIKSNQRITTVKTRLIAKNHQMLRVDEEDVRSLTSDDELTFIEVIENILETEKIDALLLQDYNKGVLTNSGIQQIIKLAKAKKVPTVVDPKKDNFLNFKEVDLFKPNLKELEEGLNIKVDPTSMESLNDAAKKLQKELNCRMVMITLSENGVYILNDDKGHHYKAHLRNIADVSGAGDTVISVASCCLAQNSEIGLMTQLANLSGGLVCEKVGVVPIIKENLLREAMSIKL